MKKFFGSRGGALVVAVIVVLLGTYFGAMIHLGNASRYISNGFYSGVIKDEKGKEYEETSVYSQLRIRCIAGKNLVSTANNYPDVKIETSDLLAATTAMEDLLNNNAGPHDLYNANSNLELAFNALSDKLDEIEKDKKDIDKIADYRNEMKASAAIIADSGYNDSVKRFVWSTLSVFPGNIFRAICPIQEPELFATSNIST